MRTLHSLSVLALFSVLLAGCHGPSTDTASNDGGANAPNGKKMRVGFVQMGAESVWRTAETNSMADEAKRLGVDYKFVDSQGKQENEIRNVRNFIAQKMDVIFLAPVVESGWEPVLKEAKQANIPVILLDRGIDVKDPSLYATLIGSDFVDEGKRAGEKLAELIGNKGNVVELQGTVGSAAALERKKGFDAALALHPDVKVIASESGDFKRANGKEVMQAMLKAHGKEIQGLFAHNDDMAMGAIQAIQEAGMKPGTDIKIVSIDGIKDAIDAVAKGQSNVSVECNPLLGKVAFETAAAILAGKTVPKKVIQHDDLFDSANAAKVLPTRKY